MKTRDENNGRFLRQPVAPRFWAKVEQTDQSACWEWLAGKDRGGYGMFWLNGITTHAQRIAWILTYGDIPDELDVCHRCDNPSCVNPRHLFLGSDRDNHQDRAKKGRSARNLNMLGRKGEKHPNAKLTNRTVLKARELYKRKRFKTIKKMALRIGVNHQTLLNAANGKTWSHI
ncbi:MAG: HNH endonuclease signature motif containing protein [Caldilineaceae bacterium]